MTGREGFETCGSSPELEAGLGETGGSGSKVFRDRSRQVPTGVGDRSLSGCWLLDAGCWLLDWLPKPASILLPHKRRPRCGLRPGSLIQDGGIAGERGRDRSLFQFKVKVQSRATGGEAPRHVTTRFEIRFLTT